MKALLIGCIGMILSLGLATALTAKRRSLPRPELETIKHQPTGMNLGVDPKTGTPLVYDVEGEITYDRRSGNFLLTWTGKRGNRLTVVYESPLKVDAIISAAVAYDVEASLCRYTYSVRVLPSSQQKLRALYVETRAPVQQLRSPDSSWVSFPLSDHQKENLRIAGGRQWSQTREGRVGLPPGASASGFSYVSSGLPSLVRCYVRGRTSLKYVGEEIPEELLVAVGKADWTIPQGVTVGPESFPEPFRAIPLLEKIEGYVATSLENGWIESIQVAEQIHKSLEQLRQTIKSGERKRTDRILRELLARIETEKDKTLLSEAYALLRFNLEYLQQKLQGK